MSEEEWKEVADTLSRSHETMSDLLNRHWNDIRDMENDVQDIRMRLGDAMSLLETSENSNIENVLDALADIKEADKILSKYPQK